MFFLRSYYLVEEKIREVMKMNVTGINNQPNVRMNAKRVNNQPNFKANVEYLNRAAQIDIARCLEGETLEKFKRVFQELSQKGGDFINHSLAPAAMKGNKIGSFHLQTTVKSGYENLEGMLFLKFAQVSPTVSLENLPEVAESHSKFLTAITKSDLTPTELKDMDVATVKNYIELEKLKKQQEIN